MGRYRVMLAVRGYANVYVTADSEEDAEKRAVNWPLLDDFELEPSDLEIEEVESLDEDE